MNNKILMIIAPDKFRDEELFQPKKIFEENGFSVEISSKDVSTSTGMLGKTITIDKDVSKIIPDEYDAVVFVGGSGCAMYFDDPEVLELAQEFNLREKIIGAICIAPSILTNAGLLKNRKATSYPSERINMMNSGVDYVECDVVDDENFITANGPTAARKFAEKICSKLKAKEIEYSNKQKDETDIYDDDSITDMLENDEISSEEEGFMRGREITPDEETELLEEERDLED